MDISYNFIRLSETPLFLYGQQYESPVSFIFNFGKILQMSHSEFNFFGANIISSTLTKDMTEHKSR